MKQDLPATLRVVVSAAMAGVLPGVERLVGERVRVERRGMTERWAMGLGMVITACRGVVALAILVPGLVATPGGGVLQRIGVRWT